MWFQSRDFCNKINEYLMQPNFRVKIENKNVYKTRYDNNNDLFVHVRLGDVQDKNKKQFVLIINKQLKQ